MWPTVTNKILVWGLLLYTDSVSDLSLVSDCATLSTRYSADNPPGIKVDQTKRLWNVEFVQLS